MSQLNEAAFETSFVGWVEPAKPSVAMNWPPVAGFRYALPSLRKLRKPITAAVTGQIDLREDVA